jgi:hypothetical protein
MESMNGTAHQVSNDTAQVTAMRYLPQQSQRKEWVTILMFSQVAKLPLTGIGDQPNEQTRRGKKEVR